MRGQLEAKASEAAALAARLDGVTAEVGARDEAMQHVMQQRDEAQRRWGRCRVWARDVLTLKRT